MFPKRLYTIFLHINYQKKNMKHCHIVWIITLSKVTRNSLNTKFEMFFKNLLNDISAIPEENVVRIKRNYDQP